MNPPLFRNDQIALDLGINVGFKKKVELRKLITENGGIVSYNVTNKCSFVVASDPEKCDISLKCRMAVKYGLPVVSLDYIWDCVGASEKLSIDRYTIGGKSKALDFRSGKISATEDKTQTSVKRFKSKSSFNVHSVHVWRSGEIEAPQFDEENYEVAKYAIFKGMKKKQDMCSFYCLEIHVASVPALLDNAAPKYRIFSHHGSLQDALAGKVCAVELRYTATADQALAGFSTLYREQTTVHKMQVVDGVAPRNVGSRKLQQILSVLETEIGVASPAVSEIVEHIWREAIGEVESVLQIPITAVKVDQVEKAEALLVKIRDGLKNKENVEDVVKEFFDTLPHKTESPYTTKPTTAWLSRKQDLCQLIKDMVSVSEATSWSARPSVQSKYRALRCNISFVEPGSYEHKNISEDIQSSVDRQIRLNITNIFTIQRPIEDPGFRADLNNKRHLFHSSKVENFLGILSRGLLLPKVVVDDYGGTRSDAGNLGSGIYFASAASTSALYSTPSKTRETRLMLIDEVALGKCCDFTHKDESLTKPPDGYNSVHGVGKKHDNTSEFQDDEYVVYNVNQQRLRYLVEFTVDSEVPGARLQIEDLYEKMDISEFPLDDIDLHDVQGVADPLSHVKPGLVGNQVKGRVELKAVHVRAKLLDLAAQVVVFQEYHNNSFSAIEAKYVFPLGDGAVVCGFEAFINDKHIVGEVKEKETAHKEYKQAISEGHGAYLMDQDEETPDVFTVSVGNLPPKAVVLIKITYVAELQVEAELISFRLPGSVAPWKQDTAANKKTQDKLDTFKVKSGKTSLQVAIEMPFDIRTLECPSHRVRVKRTASKAVVELRSDQDIQDGFHLVVGLAEIHVPRMWVERHSERPDHQACMLTFYPEFEVGSNATTDVIILLDVSNSMKGDSLQSAKKVVLLILRSLDPAWTFNVVLFGTRYKELFPNSQAQTEDNLVKAQKFIQMAQADMGNTEVFRPLHAYFLLPPVEGAMRNVLLVSDGHLNNETSVLADASSNYQHTRIFTFGVSATCNVFTLKALARVSAGAFEFFDTKVKSKWEEKVKRQLGKAGQPGLSSVAVEWRQYDDNLPQPIQAPRHITSLFNGTRQVIYGFVPNCTMALLSAIVGGQEVSTVVSTSDLAITTGLVVHRLTAHAIIQDWEVGLLSDDRTHHEVAKMNSKEDVIKLSKEFSIVTQFTSFVAIERREKDEDMSTQKGPSITELVNTEGVDILDYMGWPQQEDKPTVFKAIMLVEPSADETLPAVSVRAKALIRKPMMCHISYDDDEPLADLEEWSEEDCAESALLLSDTSPSAKAYLESAPQDSIVPLQEGAVSTGMGGMHKSHEKGLIPQAWSGEKYRDEIVETDTSDAESPRFEVFQNEATTLPLVSRMKQQPGFSFGISPDRSHVTDDLMEASPASEAYLGSALQDSIVPQSQDIVPPPSALPSSKASLIRSAPQDSIVPLQQGSVPVQRAPPRSRTFSLCSSALHVSRAFQPQVLPAAMPSFGSTRRYSHDPQTIDSLERQSEEKSEVINRSHATDDLKEAPVGARTFSSRSSALHVSRAFQTKAFSAVPCFGSARQDSIVPQTGVFPAAMESFGSARRYSRVPNTTAFSAGFCFGSARQDSIVLQTGASLERQSEGGNEVISETQSMENLAAGKSSLMTESLGADFQDIDKIRPETKKKKKAFELQEDYHHIMLDTSSDDLTISRSSASEFQEMPVSPQYEPESPQYEPESPQYEPESSASVFRKVSQAVFSEQQSFAYSAPQKLEKWNVSHYSFASAPPPPPLPPSGGAMGAAGLYTSQVLPPEVSSSFNVAQIEKLEHSDLLSEKKSRGVRFSSHEQDRRKSGPHFRGFLGKRVQRIPEAARLYSDPVRSELKRKPDEESRTVVDGFSCRMVGLDEWKWQMQNKMDALLLKVNDSCYLDDSIQELLSVDVEKCRKLMMSSGLGSFGQAAASEIQQLVARLLILLSIIIVNDYRWTNGEEGSKEAILFLHELLMGKNKESLKSALILESSAALKWCQTIDGKYPLACFSLELASSWPAFCGMVLGLVPEIL